ncbi:hypothetical protein M5X11_05745 [Paenibacillus alginolyticus]|uniref:hypothetical protein n=1 Tax=Paenibacillus alginolyticus TaxID=59839 RepID=UPI000FD6FB5E|nr:hypothetical protein [Paenibacillus alginolyticus]MCY9664458.1 hypothetical protein [Paenibacillus alginolyticus]
MHTFTKYAMPIYNQDHATYILQMYEWHIKMVQYNEQLRAYHLERAKYFQKLVEERSKSSELSKEVTTV